MSRLLKKIQTLRHWKIVVRPCAFDENRVADKSDLLHILEKTYVQFGNPLPFPNVDSSAQVDEGIDWIGQEKESEIWEIVELWRFYQSGQFVCYKSRVPNHNKCQPLDPMSLVVSFSEIFEFAARLSHSHAGDDWMHLDVTLAGIDRPLKVGASLFQLTDEANTDVQYKVDLSTLDLVTKTRELALKPVAELFHRFGWNPGIDYLRDYQDELLFRRSGTLR